jgi:hypothetical protein
VYPCCPAALAKRRRGRQSSEPAAGDFDMFAARHFR